jgi:hypothetical protein
MEDVRATGMRILFPTCLEHIRPFMPVVKIQRRQITISVLVRTQFSL